MWEAGWYCEGELEVRAVMYRVLWTGWVGKGRAGRRGM